MSTEFESDDEKVLEMESGNGCTTSWICLMPLNCMLKIVKMSKKKKVLSISRRSFPFKVQFHSLLNRCSLQVSLRAGWNKVFCSHKELPYEWILGTDT